MNKLKGKRVLITGGGKGIGREIAVLFAREGANLVISYNNSAEQAQDLKEKMETECGVKIGLVKVDVSKSAEIDHLVQSTISILGGLDILVNNAGVLQRTSVETLTMEDYERIIAVDLQGVIHICQEFIPHMIEQKYGRIINIASQIAYRGNEICPHYAAAKAGVVAYSKSIARGLIKYNVNVNCIAPGPILTDMVFKDRIEVLNNRLPLGRHGEAYEVAPSALLLAAEPDGNLYVGQCLQPNCGDVMI